MQSQRAEESSTLVDAMVLANWRLLFFPSPDCEVWD